MPSVVVAAGALLVLAVWPDVEAAIAGRPAGARGALSAAPMRSLRRLASVRSFCAWLRLAAALLALAPIPVSADLVAADVDAGLACVLTAALLALTAVWLEDPRRLADRLAIIAAGGLTLGVALTPIVARVGSLNLADIVVAQQGGLGNWFAWRDPFQLVAAAGFLAAAACLQPPRGAADLDLTGSAVWTLATSGLAASAFFGGWWAFVPFLDRWPAAHLASKVLALAWAQAWLRRRLPRPDDPTGGTPPVRLLLLVTLAAVAGSLAWLVGSGEIH